jgi:hypothetical protein
MLTGVSFRLRNWPAIVATVRILEREPGVALETIDLATDGRRGEFARAVIVVRFIGES